MTTFCILDSLTTTHGEAGLPTSTAQCGGLREISARGRSPGLRSGDLSGQALLVVAGGFVLVKASVLGRATFRLALAKPPSMSRGRGGEDLRPPGRATQMLALAKPPGMSRGGLWYEEGGGSARLIAEDCLKYFLFNLKKRNTKGKIHSFKKKLIYGWNRRRCSTFQGSGTPCPSPH
jgi:hypothetical protein